MRLTQKDLDRFFAKVDKQINSPHWMWTAAKNGKGYGIFWFNGKLDTAHRQSYRMHKGEIPKDNMILHKCDIRLCVMPDCLFPGTGHDNTQDMLSKGRNVNHSKISDAAVLELLRQHHNGVRQVRLTRQFGLSHAQVSRIISGTRRTQVRRETELPKPLPLLAAIINMARIPRFWDEHFRWTHVEDSCIWFNEDTKKYHFSNECEQLDKTPYDTLDECRAAVIEYCKQL